MSSTELQLFIIWKNAMFKKEEILEDIDKNFKIRNIYKVIWSDKNWSNNLSRFYGTHLPEGSGKEEHCGKEYFLIIIVEDKKKKYAYRDTSRGQEKVNITMFDKKELYRSWTGGGHRIHATNSIEETNHDLTLLLGKNIEDFLKTKKPNKEIEEYKKDLIGAEGWNNIEEIFYTLNNCIEYVVLRDYENDMKELYDVPSYDADILCKNRIDAKWLLNAEEKVIDNSVQYEINLKNKKALFDLKYLGDDYYCYDMEDDILKTRTLHNGYYIPNEEFAYVANLYHAIVHKNNYETEYNERIAVLYPEKHKKTKTKEYYIEMLSKWMIEKGYQITVNKENPYKMNIENIQKFDKKLYRISIAEDIERQKELRKLQEEIYNYKTELKNKNNELKELKRNYEMVITSKGWRILEKLRKIRRRKK